MMAKYLLGDLTPEESRRIEEAIPCNYRLRRELEAAEEELTAAYVVGRLRGKERLKFETAFLSSEEGKLKLRFARDWLESGGSECPDLSSPLHRYILGEMTPEEEADIEKKLLVDQDYHQRLEAVECEVLRAYLHETLPKYCRELFDAHYLFTDRIVGKLRFAHILYQYEWAPVTQSPTPENTVGAGRQRLEKASRRRPQLAVGGRGQQPL